MLLSVPRICYTYTTRFPIKYRVCPDSSCHVLKQYKESYRMLNFEYATNKDLNRYLVKTWWELTPIVFDVFRFGTYSHLLIDSQETSRYSPTFFIFHTFQSRSNILQVPIGRVGIRLTVTGLYKLTLHGKRFPEFSSHPRIQKRHNGQIPRS